jgi:hypothetical protein
MFKLQYRHLQKSLATHVARREVTDRPYTDKPNGIGRPYTMLDLFRLKHSTPSHSRIRLYQRCPGAPELLIMGPNCPVTYTRDKECGGWLYNPCSFFSPFLLTIMLTAEPCATSAQDRRTDLESRISALLIEVAHLRREQNTLTPVSRLPPEVLSRIFVHARDLELGTSPFAFARVNLVPLWKILIHTCSHWRTVALGCSILWSVIQYSPHWGWSTTALEHASMTPLSIYVEIGYRTTNHPFHEELILPRIQNAKALSLNISTSALNGYLSLPTLLESTTAPILETLELAGPS